MSNSQPIPVVGFRLPGEPSPPDSVLNYEHQASPPLPLDMIPPTSDIFNFYPRREQPKPADGAGGAGPARRSMDSSRRRSLDPPEVGPKSSSTPAALISYDFQTQTSLSPRVLEANTPVPPPTPDTPPPTSQQAASMVTSPGDTSVASGAAAPSTPSGPGASTSTAPAAVPMEAPAAGLSKEERKAAYEAAKAQQGGAAGGSKKSLTREERRAKQEAERAAKANKAAPSPSTTSPSSSRASPSAPARPAPARSTSAAPMPAPAPPPTPAAAAGPPPTRPQASDFFLHIKESASLEDDAWTASLMGREGLHPKMLHLGYQHCTLEVMGATARTRSMLEVMRHVVRDYTPPQGKVPSRDLVAHINEQVAYLAECRQPLGTGMGNAVKFLKFKMGKIDPATSLQSVQEQVLKLIDRFIKERLDLARKQIVEIAVKRIQEGDVILTHARSGLVLQVLLAAHRAMPPIKPAVGPARPRFRVIVVGTCETDEGARMTAALTGRGLTVEYCRGVGEVANAMPRATKVFLGAAAVLASGTVMTRTGAAVTALMARVYNKPVVVLCETFKFHERVQVSTSSHNELGDPWSATRVPHMLGTPDPSIPKERWLAAGVKLQVLRYDAVLPELVQAIWCEVGAIPTTSVLTLLRDNRREYEGHVEDV